MKIKFLFLQLFLLASLCLHAQDQTILLATETNFATQSWLYSGHGNHLNHEKIKEKYNDDYYITSVSYTGRGWFVALSKSCGLTAQEYKYSSEWPSDWLKEKKNSGYYITSIARGNDKWMIVMSKGLYTNQAWSWDTWSNLDGFLHKYWGMGYSITDIEFYNGKWLLVMSENSPYTGQSCVFRYSESDARQMIKQYWDEGRRIQLLEYGDGKYFILASKFKNGKVPSQSYGFNPDNINDWISKQWNEGRDVSYIGGGYKTPNNVQNNVASNHNNNYNNNNGGKTVVIDVTVPFMNGTTRHIIYSDGSGFSDTNFPCTSFHCINGRCTMCNGTGIAVHPFLGTTLPCTICNMGRCKYCNGQGSIKKQKHWAPGEAQAYNEAVRQIKNAGYNVPEKKTKSNSGVCPDCHGHGYRPQAYTYAAASSFAPYHNYSGNTCPICNRVTDHYHYRCTTCKKF